LIKVTGLERLELDYRKAAQTLSQLSSNAERAVIDPMLKWTDNDATDGNSVGVKVSSDAALVVNPVVHEPIDGAVPVASDGGAADEGGAGGGVGLSEDGGGVAKGGANPSIKDEGAVDIAAEIKVLWELTEKGILTPDEFKTKKTQLLSRI
jgi:hypothetical protein